MNINKKTLVLLPICAALLASVEAVPIQGDIKFNLDDNSFFFDNESVTFNAADSGDVSNASGDYAAYINDDVVFKSFNYDTFAGPIADLWTIPGTGVSFDLHDLLFIDYGTTAGGEFVLMYGTGVAHIPGLDSIAARWTFSADAVSGVHNYSSTLTVPEGGSVLAFFGLTLLGCAVAARRVRNRSIIPV